MCLVTYDPNPRVSEHEIFCWKILYRRVDGTLFSPYRNKRYELHRRYWEEGDAEVAPSFFNEFRKTTKPIWYVGKGYIHAYKRFSTALNHLVWEESCGHEVVLCKCIVLHGTPYFINEENGEICARSMLLIHTVDHDYLKHDTDHFGNRVRRPFGYIVWLSLHNFKRKIRKRLKLKRNAAVGNNRPAQE